MANTKSAIKRIRSSAKKRERNRVFRSRARTFVKKTKRLIAEGKIEEAREKAQLAISALDKAAEKGMIVQAWATTAELWQHSKLIKENPEWLLKGAGGRPPALGMRCRRVFPCRPSYRSIAGVPALLSRRARTYAQARRSPEDQLRSQSSGPDLASHGRGRFDPLQAARELLEAPRRQHGLSPTPGS